MNLHEYQAKQLLPLWLTSTGGLCLYYSARSRRSRFKIGASPWVVKCQVHAEGGAVKRAVKESYEQQRHPCFTKTGWASVW